MHSCKLKHSHASPPKIRSPYPAVESHMESSRSFIEPTRCKKKKEATSQCRFLLLVNHDFGRLPIVQHCQAKILPAFALARDAEACEWLSLQPAARARGSL